MRIKYCSAGSTILLHYAILMLMPDSRILLPVHSQELHHRDAANDEILRQVLEEEERYYSNGDDDDGFSRYQEPSREDEDLLRKQREEEERRMEEERMERIRREREQAFEKEVAKMNEEQKKLAKQQKRKDARICRRILGANERGDLYGVLGLREIPLLKLNPREFQIGPLSWNFPGWDGLRISSQDIRRAYRELAKKVHPDKNRDGNAVAAFHAVEEAASILSDDSARALYDQEREEYRRSRHDRRIQHVQTVWASVDIMARGVYQIVHQVIGPFFVPISILSALLV